RLGGRRRAARRLGRGRAPRPHVRRPVSDGLPRRLPARAAAVAARARGAGAHRRARPALRPARPRPRGVGPPRRPRTLPPRPRRPPRRRGPALRRGDRRRARARRRSCDRRGRAQHGQAPGADPALGARHAHGSAAREVKSMGRAIIQHIDDAPWVRGGPRAEGPERHPEGGGQLVGDLERGPWVHVNWLPGGLVAPPHQHDQDEVLFILERGLSMRGRRCGPGTVVYLERATPYGFTVWDEGVRFLNVRPGRASIELGGKRSDPYRAPGNAAEPAATDGIGVLEAIHGLRAVRRYEDRPVPQALL